jgi:hypothetical protein
MLVKEHNISTQVFAKLSSRRVIEGGKEEGYIPKRSQWIEEIEWVMIYTRN